MADNHPPEVQAPRTITVVLEWFPDLNQMKMSVTGGDPMQYRGMLLKAADTLNQLEAGQAKPNRVQLAPGPIPRSH